MGKMKPALDFIPTILLGVLSVVYLIEWRVAREESLQILRRVSEGIDLFGKRLDVHATRWMGHVEGIRKAQEALLEQGKGTLQAAKGLAQVKLADGSLTETEGAATPAGEIAAVDEELPPPPDGIEPAKFLKEWDANTFFQDPRWNPDRKELTRAQKNRALAEVTDAKCMMEVFDAQVRAETAEGMETMRADGRFVEYGQGAKPVPVRGVFSAGEATEEKGMRRYYYFPEEYPGIYQKRREKKKIAEAAVRR